MVVLVVLLLHCILIHSSQWIGIARQEHVFSTCFDLPSIRIMENRLSVAMVYFYYVFYILHFKHALWLFGTLLLCHVGIALDNVTMCVKDHVPEYQRFSGSECHMFMLLRKSFRDFL